MKIGVSGASGHLGGAVVSELLQRPGGHEVVAITRTPKTAVTARIADYIVRTARNRALPSATRS